MSKSQWKALALSLMATLTIVILVIVGTVSISNAQMISVQELRDVQPTDYYYESLRSLVERYGCIANFPDRTFRANNSLTRGEMVNMLNSCMNVMERIAEEQKQSNSEEIRRLKSLTEELITELATLSGRIDQQQGEPAGKPGSGSNEPI